MTLLPLGEVRRFYGNGLCGSKREYHRGLTCLIRVGMKMNGWLGDRGGSRTVLNRVWNMVEALSGGRFIEI